MDDKTKLGATLVGGYLLGRTKKGRVALRVALLLAGRKETLNPDVLREGLERLGASTGSAGMIDQVRGPLLDAARRAAIATVEGRINALSDGLAHRTEALTQQPLGPDGDGEAADEDFEEESTEQEEAPEEEPQPRRRTQRAARSTGDTSTRTSRQGAPRPTSREGNSRKSTTRQGTGKQSTSREGTSSKSTSRQAPSRQGSPGGKRGTSTSATRSGGQRTQSATRSSGRTGSNRRGKDGSR